MQTILRILQRAGGYRPSLYLKIENPPYMALVIEGAPGIGPAGLPALSVAHYGEMNGDLMRDPEMCFELVKPLGCESSPNPYYWRNDYVDIECWSRFILREQYVVRPTMHTQHGIFATKWDGNLKLQGFEKAFSDKSILG
jgi:hypothetical protein